MYKVFINEKLLLIGSSKSDQGKSFVFEDENTLEIAFDQLNNTSQSCVTVYGPKPEKIWQTLTEMLSPVEAAGGVVLNTDRKILFIYRLERWDLPKGKAELGETPEITAVREVEEECSIAPLEIILPLSPTYHIYQDKKRGTVLKTTHWFLMNYSGEKPAQPQIEEGISQVNWMDAEEISQKVLPCTFENIKLVISEAKEKISSLNS